jgi:hypothetical protein
MLHGQSFKDCHAVMLANHGTCKQLRPRLLVVCRALKSSFARATAGRFIHPACVHTHTQVLLGTQHTRALAGDDCMQTQSRVHGPLRASLSTTLLINNSSTSTLCMHIAMVVSVPPRTSLRSVAVKQPYAARCHWQDVSGNHHRAGQAEATTSK